jgi:sec-independent protein translocase protein TatA
MPNLGAGEWLIILLVIVILFGSAKLPTLARSLGKSMRILKAETKGLHDDDDEAQQAKAQQPAQQPQQPQQAAQQQPQQQSYQAPQRELPVGSDEPISGVPVTEAERRRNA